MSTAIVAARRSGRRGQSLAEFALVLPVFLLILFGLLDLGALVFSDNVMSQAAREGARVASTEAGWIGKADVSCGQPGGPVCPTAAVFATDVTNAVMRSTSGLTSGVTVYVRCDPASSPPTGAWTTGSCAANNTAGNLVSVRIVYSYRSLTPVGRLISSVTRSGAATMVIN
jgi:Flp pilus assembly protein TadG